MSGEHSTAYSGEIEGLPDFADDGSHLDAFMADDGDADGSIDHDVRGLDEIEAEADEFAHAQMAETQLTTDQFWTVFQTGFSLPGMFAPAFAPLAIQEGETMPARGASDAIHRLLEIYYPRALQPGSETLALVMQCAPFLIAKVMVVRMVLQEMRHPPIEMPPEPANTNEAPPPDARENVKSAMSWMDAEAAA